MCLIPIGLKEYESMINFFEEEDKIKPQIRDYQIRRLNGLWYFTAKKENVNISISCPNLDELLKVVCSDNIFNLQVI